LLPDGGLAWQRLHGFVYGKGIAKAQMFQGAAGFCAARVWKACRSWW
jgi:hypothetical protein